MYTKSSSNLNDLLIKHLQGLALTIIGLCLFANIGQEGKCVEYKYFSSHKL